MNSPILFLNNPFNFFGIIKVVRYDVLSISFFTSICNMLVTLKIVLNLYKRFVKRNNSLKPILIDTIL